MSRVEHLFCSKPFEWFEVSQLNGRGGVYLCCPAWLNTCIGNIRHQSVAEIWNGKPAQRIRQSVLNGSFRYCDFERCAYLQNTSGPVQKISEVRDETLLKVIDNNRLTLPWGPRKIICTYDQSCNLSCPTCRQKVIVETGARKEILAIENKIRKEALRDAELLYISGSGDPFGSPYFRKWLQSMRRKEMPALKEICLHTNGQLWTPEMWQRLPEEIRALVKSAEISMDAADAETYHINRRGGDFNRLLENLDFIRSLHRNGPLKCLKISMVVQANNFRQMPDFVRLGRRFDVDRVYFGRLLDWGTFSRDEYDRRAVHHRRYAKHKAFLKVLEDPILQDPIADLGNLTRIKNRPVLSRLLDRMTRLVSKTGEQPE